MWQKSNNKVEIKKKKEKKEEDQIENETEMFKTVCGLGHGR